MMFSRIKYTLVAVLMLMASLAFAQEKDKALQNSNDLVYEGNELVEDDFIAAEKEYRRAISIKPSNTPAPYNLGNAYYNSGHYNEALIRHIEAAELATTKADKHRAYHNIGNTLMKKKLCKEAIEAYKNALRNDPSDDESRYNLAIAKECARNQGGGGGGGEDDQEQDDEEEKDQEQNQEGDDQEDKNDGDDQEDQDGKPSDENDQKNEGEGRNEKKEQEPRQGKLSPQQVRSLLEAMNNQERKVQEKINAQKVKGPKVKNEKDWWLEMNDFRLTIVD